MTGINLLKDALREHILCLPHTLKLRYHGTWRRYFCELTAQEIFLQFVMRAKAGHMFEEVLWLHVLRQLFLNHVTI